MNRSMTWARWMLVVLAPAATVVSASPATPARFDALDSQSRTIALTDDAGARQTPFAGFSIHPLRGGEWTLVTLYVMFREVVDGDARRRESYWVARRVTGDDSPRAKATPEIRWASSDACEALDGLVRGIGEVIGDRLEIGVPGDGDPTETASDNVRYSLWTTEGRFRGTALATTVNLASTGGSPIAEWADHGLAATQSCWTGTTMPGATTGPG